MNRFKLFYLIAILPIAVGCAAIFGWDIHAPGVLSESFYQSVKPAPERIALYINPAILDFESKDRGGATADPQTYHVGEAFGPMLLEAFQAAFDEFIFLEVEPTPQIMKRYGITHAVSVRIKDFNNHVTWKGQGISLATETVVLDQDLHAVDRFESTGVSDAKKVFAKKGGPQVNLNAAVENNVLSIVQNIQDFLKNP